MKTLLNKALILAVSLVIQVSAELLDEEGRKWPQNRPRPFQSNPWLDFLGQIPNLTIAKNSRAKIEIPEGLFREIEPSEFHIECEEIDHKGRRTIGYCNDVNVFIDQDSTMWIQPSRKWTGRIRVTLESVNMHGDRDQTCFDVDVLESDPEKCVKDC
jgi:hypothetical protein